MNLATVGITCGSGGPGASSSCGFLSGTMGGIAALGAGMLTWGLWAWLTSRNLVVSTLQEPPPEPLGPPAMPSQPASERLLPRPLSALSR
jgi:hypothetical protein